MNKPIRKVMTLETVPYYIQHLNIVNSMFPIKLVNKEIEVLAHFLALDSALVGDDRFNTEARKRVRQQFSPILSAGGLGNYLRTMIEKRFLIKSEVTGKIKINPLVIPNTDEQIYLFKLIRNEQT